MKDKGATRAPLFPIPLFQEPLRFITRHAHRNTQSIHLLDPPPQSSTLLNPTPPIRQSCRLHLQAIVAAASASNPSFLLSQPPLLLFPPPLLLPPPNSTIAAASTTFHHCCCPHHIQPLLLPPPSLMRLPPPYPATSTAAASVCSQANLMGASPRESASQNSFATAAVLQLSSRDWRGGLGAGGDSGQGQVQSTTLSFLAGVSDSAKPQSPASCR